MESELTMFAFTRYGYRKQISTELPVVHSHPQYEIHYIHSGECCYMLGGSRTTVQIGDLILLSGLTSHGLYTTAQGMVSTKLIFDPQLMHIFNDSLKIRNPLEPFKRMRIARTRLDVEARSECEHILTQINRFYGERNYIRFTRLLVAFYDLLLFIGDQCGISEIEKSYPSSDKERVANEMIDFFELHYMEELRLEDMENRFHLNKYHLSKTFREVTGLSIFEYLCHKRIDQAKLLLHQDGGTNAVSDVCYHVGYNHPAHFSRVFKKLVGISPEQYRKLLK